MQCWVNKLRNMRFIIHTTYTDENVETKQIAKINETHKHKYCITSLIQEPQNINVWKRKTDNTKYGCRSLHMGARIEDVGSREGREDMGNLKELTCTNSPKQMESLCIANIYY